jgi:hypothetical protein
MTRKTMTDWIEIADERQFRENTMADEPRQVSERQHLHLGSAILSLPGRIIRALTHQPLPDTDR